MTQYPIAATNKILVGGVPLHMEFEAATSSAILPGDLVQFNIPASDCNIKEGANDSEEIIGVADITPTPGATPPRGGNRVTAFAAGDQIVVLRGPLTVMLRVATSEEIQCGEFVQPAASGEVKAYQCGTDNDCQRIAQSLETLTQDTEAFQWGLFALERFG
uniref:Uncharacterized protein n=1 Tax=viral metagenome TaxID=1070528 RepID=A0A6M3LY15_9ZZZZ